MCKNFLQTFLLCVIMTSTQCIAVGETSQAYMDMEERRQRSQRIQERERNRQEQERVQRLQPDVDRYNAGLTGIVEDSTSQSQGGGGGGPFRLGTHANERVSAILIRSTPHVINAIGMKFINNTGNTRAVWNYHSSTGPCHGNVRNDGTLSEIPLT